MSTRPDAHPSRVAPDVVAERPPGPEPAAPAALAGGRPRRRRLVLWVSLAVAAVVAVLVAVLASAGPAAQRSASSPLIGKPAPPLGGTALQGGGSYHLSEAAGKWVLVNFAASWCVPCRQEMPQLLAFHHEHAARGDAVIVTVAEDEGDIPNLTRFLASRHATWPAIDDPAAVVDWGVGQIPESYLVDPQGTVVAKYFGGVNAATLDSFIHSFPAGGPAESPAGGGQG